MSDAKADEVSTHVERASDRELVLRRTFRARPQIVFDAMTKAELIRRWWAPRSLGVELLECTTDPRVGGAYRFVFGKKDKPPMAFSGVYKEFVRGARVAYTQIFEPMREAGEGLVTATYEETPEGFTRLVQRELYPSKEVLDGAISSGMEKGMRETLDQLADLVLVLVTEV
ncbi:MAG TPA: SRPBCC domain-containing protein [Polyangiaceae bacterium]|jgi:uncharacterized protein YndB with AHSA1/START domain